MKNLSCLQPVIIRFLRTAILSGFCVAMTWSLSAQNAMTNRKPSKSPASSPSQINGTLPSDARPWNREDLGMRNSSPVPVYDRIDTPIRWYAIENEFNPAYWQGVDAERIWLRLEQGFSFDDERIETFLLSRGLWEVVGESYGENRGDLRVYRLPDAQPAVVVDLARAAQHIPGIEFLEPAVIYRTHFTPNDPYYAFQWGPWVTSFDLAWDEAIGGSSFNVVAVIDDACDWLHEDLYDIVWYGWDYAQNDGDIYPDDPVNHKHGTHVTGTVAAKTNNGIGVAGMVSDTVYFGKVGNPDGSLSDQAIYEAIYDIADIGRVGAINMSLGGDSPSAGIEQACNYAWNNGKILLVSSGNNGQGLISYPAAYAASVAVGAIGTDGDILYLTTYSQYGAEQELVAPGGDMSTDFGIVSSIPMNQYEAMEGTSMAAPHVTGLAGLMKHINMDLTNSDIRNILAATATDFGDPGWDPIFGFGMIHAQNAVQAAINGIVGTSEVAGETILRIYPNPAEDRILVDRRIDTDSGAYEIYDLSGRKVASKAMSAGSKTVIQLQGLAPGMYVLHMQSEYGKSSARFVKY